MLKLQRGRTDAYPVLVSEVMLQQTQTHRVVPKYQAFLKAFPTIQHLAAADLADVLRLWQGLGYNRRALMLHRAAAQVVREYGGRLPQEYEQLVALPGIGPYTASAIMTFAYNQSQVFIETNIRAAIIHHFFPPTTKKGRVAPQRLVSDAQIRPILAAAVPESSPRIFYQALMDYGAFLKQKYPNPSRRSRHYLKQSAFEGSTRQIRGGVLRLCLREPQTLVGLVRTLRIPAARLRPVLATLVREGLVEKQAARYLPPQSPLKLS